jgi:FkbH-like protein
VTASEHHPFQFAISATFTAEPLRSSIHFWATELQASFDVRFAPFNQVLQTLLDPNSLFSRNTHGMNVVLVRLEDLGQHSAQREENARHLLEELRAAPERLHAPLLFCLCPPSPDNEAPPPEWIGARGLHYLSYDEIATLYPVEEPYDPEGERLGRIPYTEAFFAALGTAIVRRTHALIRPPFKLIALDCDNTLWQGICGEDGPENVFADPPREALHRAMLVQRDAGMLLAMASKNNEEDVLETFRVHPEMPLQLEDFVTWRLNWDPKADNLESIAEQLGIAADSFIFIDDNPKECAEVEDSLPEVLTLALPSDIERTPHFLDHVWAFDHPVVTEEDRKRSAYYAQAAEFGNAVRRAGSLESFMESLNLRVDIAPLTSDKVARVSQITQRTNQFNTTTIRRSEGDVQSLAASGYQVWTADVSDRFGDYGLVGVIIARENPAELYIDSMLLSCRALGRGVEHRMLSWLASQTAAETIAVEYRKTAKNKPACQFLDGIPFGTRETTENGFVFRAPSAELRTLTWRPAAPVPHATHKTPRSSAARPRSVDYGSIASRLSSVPEILAAMRRFAAPQQHDAEMTDTELKLAQIWAELLEKPVIRRHDNFFDLGGHSLVAVLLLMRIRETFGVELSIDEVYSASLTLMDLASRIEAAELGEIDPDEYARLLAEIENLSDEEARELLARENPGQF